MALIVPASPGILKAVASLTETAYYTRRFVVYAAVGLASLMAVRTGWSVFARWWVQTYPPGPPPPTVAFGVLPEPVFSAGEERGNLSITLETISGTAPDLGPQAAVYFMPAFRANVLGLELATSLAASLGFLFAPQSRDEQVYVWTREEELPGTLMANLITGHFSLKTNWQQDSQITSARSPSQEVAVKLAQDYLRRAGLLTPDLETGRTKVDFLQAAGGSLLPALSQSEANFARVHFFRADIDGKSVVTPKQDNALVQVVVSGARSSKQVVEVVYKYSPVELERSSTYPLRSSQAAWEQLQAGQGTIVRMVKGAPTLAVRNIELAYFDADTPQEFLQPVYVFRGDNGFVAYLPAVDPMWLGKE